MPSPKLSLQTTTLWEYPSQHYGKGEQGSADYRGATPSWVIWNLLQRYTQESEVVVDPMCGSGTTLDVCADTGREGIGFDLQPHHPDVVESDARDLPLEDSSVDFFFCDPPYGKNLKYSGRKECIGELDARDQAYFDAMKEVFEEAWRVLSPGGRLLIAVPNRRGLWARIEHTPFGTGRPFSRGQLDTLLRDTMLTPVTWSDALAFPPVRRASAIRAYSRLERIGRRLWPAFSGVIMVEATKKLYQGLPADEKARERVLVPALSPQNAAIRAPRQDATDETRRVDARKTVSL